jgi:proto-oncogene tyrosine-protein kinase Met
MLIDFKHERILNPVGVCMDENGLPMIILPFMESGDLLSFLRNDEKIIAIEQLLVFCLQTTEGMKFSIQIILLVA